MTRRPRAPWLLALAALAGCASGPEAAPPRLPDEARAWAAPEQVSWLRARAERLGDAPACLAALAGEAPDLAHVLATGDPDPRLRSRMAAALDVGGGGGAYPRSPGVCAADARAAAGWAALAQGDLAAALAAADEVDDALLRAEAHVVARAGALDAPSADEHAHVDEPAPALTPAQRARAAYLDVRAALRSGADARAPFARAAALALEGRDGTALARLEALRPLVSTTADPAWSLALAERALERSAPLVALHHALTASRGVDPRSAVRARALAARAHLAAGSREVALDEALRAAEQARALDDPALVAATLATVGDVLLADGNAEGAADAYVQAARAAGTAGDGREAARLRLNEATAQLKRGDAAAARAALAAEAQGDADLGARRDVLRALADLLAGDCARPTAADRVAAALARARERGALGAVEAYAGLVERLRGGPQ